jgi:hypothetical protein
MAFVPPRDRVFEQSTSNSQSVFAVTGALDAGYNAFSASMSVGDTTFGAVIEPGVAFKAGLLTYSATNQVTVTTAFDSKGTFSSGGTKQVFMGWPAAAAMVAEVFGQCKLVKSGSNLVLLPFNGDQVTIDGRPRTVPAAGVSLPPTSLTPTSNYYIYAAMSGSTVVLEANTTGHSTSSQPGQKGLEVKTGDETRTLVGFARCVTGPAWADSSTQRFVISWFNRDRRDLIGSTDSTSTETSTSAYGEKSVSKVEFLCWATEAVQAFTVGTMTNTSTAALSLMTMIDGFTVGTPSDGNPAAGQRIPVTSIVNLKLAEGYHYLDYGFKAIGGGTASAQYGITNTACVG